MYATELLTDGAGRVFKRKYHVGVYSPRDIYDINERVLFDVHDPDLPEGLRTLDMLEGVYNLESEGIHELMLLFREDAFFKRGKQYPAPPSEWKKDWHSED